MSQTYRQSEPGQKYFSMRNEDAFDLREMARRFSMYLVTFEEGPQRAWRSDKGALEPSEAIELIRAYYFERNRIVRTITAYGKGFHVIYNA